MGEMWLYLDTVSGAQKGPFPEEILKRLLRNGIIQPTQFAWTQRLASWAPLAETPPFQVYCQVWSAYWYYIGEKAITDPIDAAGERLGPVTTKELVSLFVDGEIDGMTLVWTKDMTEWKPISEVPSLKEFLHEANEDMERETQILETQNAVSAADQVYDEAAKEVFVAEDGKQYIFDAESKKWVTPEEKIEEDLEALRQNDHVNGNGDVGEHPQSNNVADLKALHESRSQVVEQPKADGENGHNNNSTSSSAASVNAANTTIQQQKKKKKKKKSDKWQTAKTNTWIYVNGLPLDITVQEVHDHFAKCGVIQQDLVTSEPRIKLYRSKDYGGLNGDASVCYMKEASVELAVQLLDKSHIRPEYILLSAFCFGMTMILFTQKGTEFVKRKKPKLNARAKVKKIEQEKALSWNEGEDGERDGLRIVVIKHMFTPDEIKDEEYENELKEDIQLECLKIGEVTKITLFSKHVDGVVVIKFASSGSAAKCVEVMNGRFFAGRKLECSYWDGTDYTYRESKDEENERAEKFKDWLEEGSSESEAEEEDDDKENRDDGAQEEHAGRVMPDLDSDDDEDEDTKEGRPNTTSEVHAGRVMPDLDENDDDDD